MGPQALREKIHQKRPSKGALQKSELEFQHLLEKLPAGAYTCNPEGLITYFNSYAVKLWGRAPKLNDPEDRFCGSFKLFSPNGIPIAHDRCWMALALQLDKEFNGQEIVIERPDGQRLTVLAHANPIHDESGQLIGAVNVLTDISEHKRMEEALRASKERLQQQADLLTEADRRKDEFLAVLAHELRNPMAPIANTLDLLTLAGHEPEVVAKAVPAAKRQLHQLVRLVEDLLDVSRITRGKISLRREQVTVEAVVQSALETSRPALEAAGHTLTVALSEAPLGLQGDLTRLAQALSNLLINAAKYTPAGGKVDLAAYPEEGEAVIKVQDNGRGIPASLLPRLFDMFSQPKPPHGQAGGLGVGLPLVKELVELHGGRVEAASAGPGQGSTFTVRLPLEAVGFGRAATGGETPPEKAQEAIATARRILVVDDNVDAANTLTKMLALLGYPVRTAYEGESALERARVYRPDVVLLDLGMPGMDGWEVARRLRQQPAGAGIVLIALTGWGQDADRQRTREAGFDHHLVKPVELQALTKLLL